MIIASEWMESWIHLCGILIITAVSVAIAIAIGFCVRSRFPKASQAWKETVQQQIRWPYHAMVSTFFLLSAVTLWHQERPAISLYFGGFALMELVVTVWSIRRHRSQWSIRTLLLITLMIAIACSLVSWKGWPMVMMLTAVAGVGLVLLFVFALVRRWLVGPLHSPENDHDGSA